MNDELALHQVVQGSAGGVPVVLSHALGVDLSMWDELAQTLAADHPVLRYDHRGHGGSAVPPGPYTMDQLVDDAARVVEGWGRGPVVFVGLSMGGMVAQGLGVRYPQLVRALVLANTTARYPAAAQPGWQQRIAAVEAGGVAAVVDAVVERWLTAPTRAARPELEAEIRACLLRCDGRGYAACCHAVAAVDWLDRLPAIACPTLVLAGSEDQGATPAMAHEIAERIPGARMQLLEGAAHLSVAERPLAFAQALRSFLADL